MDPGRRVRQRTASAQPGRRPLPLRRPLGPDLRLQPALQDGSGQETSRKSQLTGSFRLEDLDFFENSFLFSKRFGTFFKD